MFLPVFSFVQIVDQTLNQKFQKFPVKTKLLLQAVWSISVLITFDQLLQLCISFVKLYSSTILYLHTHTLHTHTHNYVCIITHAYTHTIMYSYCVYVMYTLGHQIIRPPFGMAESGLVLLQVVC